MLSGSAEADLFGSAPQQSPNGSTNGTADDIFGDAQQTNEQPQGSANGSAQPLAPTPSADDIFGSAPSGGNSTDVLAPQSGNDDDIYAQGPAEPAEPEKVSALVEWQEKKNQEIAVIDQQETEEIAKMRAKAQEELDAFNKKIEEAQETRAKHNLSVDEETKASLEESSSNQWERVVKYIDFNRTELHEKDVSKMKSLLLQLKH